MQTSDATRKPKYVSSYGDLVQVDRPSSSRITAAAPPPPKPPESGKPRLLTSRQVADRLTVSERSVRLKAELGEIPALRIGGLWRFWSSEIDEWLKRQRHEILTVGKPSIKT